MSRPVVIALAALALLVSGCAGRDSGDDEPAAKPRTDRATKLMYDLVDIEADVSSDALREVVAVRDRRFVAVLIELVRAAELGLAPSASYDRYVRALEAVSGKELGSDWPSWVRWYASTKLRPPPGFTAWKGELLGGIDSGFGRFLRAGAPTRIRVEEVQWGGVRVDGIPALDNPSVVAAGAATYLRPNEPVFGIALNGHARAYPLRILDWHEMANDVVGGVPVALAYCTLCGAGIAFDGRASDGRTYTFGSSGLLFRSNKLMYDRQTRTLWNQLTGEPVLGPLAASEVRLALLPVVLTRWGDWRRQHPDTTVLSVNTGFNRPYRPGAAYGRYFASQRTMFPVWRRRRELPDKERVYGLRVAGVPKAYPVSLVARERVVNDVVGRTPIVLVGARGRVQVDGNDLRAGPVRYEAGAEIRAFQRGTNRFRPTRAAGVVRDAGGRSWRVTEDALLGPDGRRLPRIDGHLAYWFGWYSFFPRTLLYR